MGAHNSLINALSAYNAAARVLRSVTVAAAADAQKIPPPDGTAALALLMTTFKDECVCT
jgi:hypothetical protein